MQSGPGDSPETDGRLFQSGLGRLKQKNPSLQVEKGMVSLNFDHRLKPWISKSHS